MICYKGNKWIVPYQTSDNSKLTLLCFPYAGGRAAIFEPWAKNIPKAVDLVAIELPGHGTRLSEKPIGDLRIVIGEIIKAALPLLSKPYVVFGHSMGAILAFEFTRYLRRQGTALPLHMFLSAQEGARFNTMNPKYILPDDEFIEYLRKKAGTSEKILASNELMNCLLPMLRIDHKLSENYYNEYKEEPSLNCPITVLAGLDDDIQKEALELWHYETNNQFNIEYFPGGHFFIFPQQTAVISSIFNKIEKYYESIISFAPSQGELKAKASSPR